MKKLLAGILIAAMLTTVSSFSLAEGKKGANSSAPKDRFQNILVTRADDMAKLQEAFQDRKTKIETKRAQMDEKKASFATKKEEFKAFRAALMTNREEMRKLMKEGNAIREENAKLREDLMVAIEALKTSGVEMTDIQKTTLAASMEQIKVLRDKIQETKGQIHSILKDNKGFVKAKDYIAMDLAFDEIYAIQALRNDSLTQINAILMTLVQLFTTVV